VTKLTEGNYLFVHYGYGHNHQPQLSLLPKDGDVFTHFEPRGKTFTLDFDTNKRYCGGWHDLATAESFPCPDAAELFGQYDQCRHCQQKTGFNPAFYNASSVSQQQQARNATPHILYLAHFAPGVVKVGISWAKRGIRRLLDQGARSAVIIKTYPNADIARQYEARAAKLPGIAETLQLRQKHQYLKRPYDAIAGAEELRATRDRLVKEISLSPDNNNEPMHLDSYFLANNSLHPQDLVDISKNNAISGNCLGMVGSVLITEQDGLQYSLPLGKLTGRNCTLSYAVAKNNAEPHQVSLF
jgi:hypothetical protein